MKFTIEKHREHLKNRRATASRARDAIARDSENLAKLERANDRYEVQIVTAEKAKKDGFDEDKYMKKRGISLPGEGE